MSWVRTLRLGEFRTVIRLQDDLSLPEADLTVVDSHTQGLAPWPNPYVLPPGEEQKSLERTVEILSHCARLGLGRDSLMVGAGGGVICDLTAFAASLYMRGCHLILIPTSLLAMVDAAIGGKTGVDFQGWKNLVGTFYPAGEVLLYPSLLQSLPEREYWCGMAEVVKHALLQPRRLWPFLLRHREAIRRRDPSVLPDLIRLAVEVKIYHVERDFRESGMRAHLNLGHTFAHALESVTGFQGVKHGEAVAWGLLRALELGLLLGLTPARYVAEVRGLLQDWGYRLRYEGVDPQALWEAMIRDKKKRAGEVRFVLQRGPGKTLVLPLARDWVLRALEGGLA